MVKALMRKRLKLIKNQKGMTLIELMAVVVILGILAAVAGTAVMGSFDKAKENTDKATKQIVLDAANRYLLDDTTRTTVTVDLLYDNGYLRESPKLQDADVDTWYQVSYSTTTKKVSITTVTGTDPVTP